MIATTASITLKKHSFIKMYLTIIDENTHQKNNRHFIVYPEIIG